MKNANQNGQRWLSQAEHDLISAKNNLKIKFYSDACFMSEQASQKALKAFLLFKGERYISIHSIAELLICCGKYDKDFKQILEKGKILDEYYIPTRYPDALPLPAVPYKSYTLNQAKQAVNYAAEIIALVKRKIRC